VEIEDIMNSEENIMDIARRELMSAFSNTFVLTSDESGVIMFEKILNIVADVKTEDLEFRRIRVLNRLSMSPPFTFKFLGQKLDEIIGVGAWKSYVDYNSHTLYVESSSTDQKWFTEMEFTVNRLKPCNMVFINVPYTAASVGLSEEISYTTLSWKYRLGAWRLGQSPFATPDGGGIIKMSKVKSVQNALLSDTAIFVADEIAYVLLNDTLRLSDFRVKQASENVVSVEYEVTSDMTNLITDIKLMNANDEVLTQASVYVPVAQTVISKHAITVKEGV
jgi:hypothetical protein